MLYTYLKDNYQSIKDTFSLLASFSRKPYLNINEFVEFCKWVNIFDQNINMLTIKECFIKANEDNAGNNSSDS